ncbi:MAG: antibiotic biosynthesis monooxygenase [Alphaproteobacteria bacterium]|nr:antibiotic biosynthesis monooxygenase [Alphaproteobacteria bacterium]MCB9693462.1 antibiotic biosynthesis monooxygenase [Alphaproteobacteria bacterium]
MIFRATLRDADPRYPGTAARLRDLALGGFGCLELVTMQEGDQEVALSYWRSLEDIQAWRDHAEHVAAQESGRTAWYSAYSVQVAHIERSYRWPRRAEV